MLLEDLIVSVCKCSVILAQQSLCLQLHGCVNMIDIHVSYIVTHVSQNALSAGVCKCSTWVIVTHHCHSSDHAQVFRAWQSCSQSGTWPRKARLTLVYVCYICVCVCSNAHLYLCCSYKRLGQGKGKGKVKGQRQGKSKSKVPTKCQSSGESKDQGPEEAISCSKSSTR